jgi:hypothetical protein
MKRTQGILIAVLILASVAMSLWLWQMRQRAHQRLLNGEDSAPTQAPAVAPAQQVSLEVANDADGSMQTQSFSLSLPTDSGARARAILGKLLDLYAAPGAPHSVPGGSAAVAQVFLLPAQSLTGKSAVPTAASPSADATAGGANPAANAADDETSPQMAVINLNSAFANSHPSGLEAETLTLLSITSSLHLNLPRITQVRFLVDGQVRPTLAGHADLTRTWLVGDSPDQTPAQQ